MIKLSDTVFVADNDKIFSTEKDCANYEKTVLATSLKEKMFDRDLNPVDNFSKGYYFLLNEEQDLKEMERLNDLYKMCSPVEDGKGFYYFDEFAERYINLSSLYNTVLNFIFKSIR